MHCDQIYFWFLIISETCRMLRCFYQLWANGHLKYALLEWNLWQMKIQTGKCVTYTLFSAFLKEMCILEKMSEWRKRVWIPPSPCLRNGLSSWNLLKCVSSAPSHPLLLPCSLRGQLGFPATFCGPCLLYPFQSFLSEKQFKTVSKKCLLWYSITQCENIGGPTS